MNNPYKKMTLQECRVALKECLAKRRVAKVNGDKSFYKKLTDEQAMIYQRIQVVCDKFEPSPEYLAKKEIKQEDRREHISKFGFAITSHALHRYRLRFEPNMTMDDLYKTMLETDLPQYLKIKTTGECGVKENVVAVIKNRLILTFKDVTMI